MVPCPCGRLRIETRLNDNDRKICVEIADTGCGIPSESEEKIFHPFFTTKKKGSGLGLAITKRLIEQHKGTITVESPPGNGAVFTLCFPVREGAQETSE